MSKRILSDAEIRHRKKVQATTSKVTGTLGLAALGGTALATKPGQSVLRSGFKAAGKKVPKHIVAKPQEPGLRNTVTPILATSAGLGALSSFNFARYTEAESRKRGPKLTALPEKKKKSIAKRYDDYVSPFEDVAHVSSASTDLQ